MPRPIRRVQPGAPSDYWKHDRKVTQNPGLRRRWFLLPLILGGLIGWVIIFSLLGVV